MDEYDFDDFIAYYDHEECEEEFEHDERYEEELLSKMKDNKDYNHTQKSAGPPSSPQNHRSHGLSKSVEDSLDSLSLCFGKLKQDIN
jgi:hypothetical protein